MFKSRRFLFLLTMVLSLTLGSGAFGMGKALADDPKGPGEGIMQPVPVQGSGQVRNSAGGAVRPLAGSSQLPANDDGSTGLVPLPFTLDFFGQTYSQLYVNNNGNVTFNGAQSTYTPYSLQSTSNRIIAPFFADVDTRVASLVNFGSGLVDGRSAFFVNWPGVGCYNRIGSVLNNFQLVLTDRSDVGPGDFDIEFNYDQVQWETGTASGGNGACQGGSSARVGYSNGTTASFELPGSAVNGAFLDGNLSTGLIHNSRNSFVNGRYVFSVRNGLAPTGGSISGHVYGGDVSNPLADAPVQVCGLGGSCNTTSTGGSGEYSTSGLAPDQYKVTAFPPGSSGLAPTAVGSLRIAVAAPGTDYLPGTVGPLTITSTESLVAPDLILVGPAAPPPGTTVTGTGTTSGGVPTIRRGTLVTLTTQGCPGGTATYQIVQGATVVASGPMIEGPAGTYTAVVPALFISGMAHVVITLICPSGPPETVEFDVVYVDPSGTVNTTAGLPIPGATVTLYRSDSSAGPFVQVPDGSAIMSPVNRVNPDLTDAIGRFGWDVIAGYYKVRAEKAGCVSPTVPGQAYVETGVLTIPPPVTGLDLRLSCAPPTAVTLSSIEAYSGFSGWIPAAVLAGLLTVFGGYAIKKRR